MHSFLNSTDGFCASRSLSRVTVNSVSDGVCSLLVFIDSIVVYHDSSCISGGDLCTGRCGLRL